MKRNYLVHHLIDNQASTSEEAIEFASSCPCCGITLLPTALHAVCVDLFARTYKHPQTLVFTGFAACSSNTLQGCPFLCCIQFFQ